MKKEGSRGNTLLIMILTLYMSAPLSVSSDAILTFDYPRGGLPHLLLLGRSVGC